MNTVNLNNGCQNISFSTTSSGSVEFQESLKRKDPCDLKKMLKDPKLSPEQRTAVLNELARRVWDDLSPAEKSQLRALLEKLKNGTISEGELDTLAKML